jgi:hypothetical protein
MMTDIYISEINARSISDALWENCFCHFEWQKKVAITTSWPLGRTILRSEFVDNDVIEELDHVQKQGHLVNVKARSIVFVNN